MIDQGQVQSYRNLKKKKKRLKNIYKITLLMITLLLEIIELN